MKIKAFFMAAAAMLCLISCEQKTVITGKLNGFENGDSVIFYGSGFSDTVTVQNGKFVLEYNRPEANRLRFFKIQKNAELMKAVRPVSLFIFPGTSLNISGDMENCTVSGGKFYEEYNPLLAQMDKMDRDAKYAFAETYIQEHPTSLVSFYLIYTMHMKNGGKYLEAFDESVKQGATADLYADLYKYYEVRKMKDAARELIQPDKPAPDFTLKNLNGEDFTLSSLKGKYVVLDFWGTWCGWCVKGIPEMKKMYDKYSDKLEIVSVDHGDSEETWREGVEKFGMNWINVRTEYENPEEDLAVKYAVNGYPTKIIISPEGNIVKVFIGETPEFYKTVETLMK